MSRSRWSCRPPRKPTRDGPGHVLNIVGDDLGVLIGRQNETLSALEFITRLMVNQQTHGRSSFTVDVNGYRASVRGLTA